MEKDDRDSNGRSEETTTSQMGVPRDPTEIVGEIQELLGDLISTRLGDLRKSLEYHYGENNEEVVEMVDITRGCDSANRAMQNMIGIVGRRIDKWKKKKREMR